MEYRRLGKSGLTVPVLSFGTATFGGGNEFFKAWGSTDVKEAKRLVDVCMDSGLNFFDTANVYSKVAAEEILGEATAGMRNRILISTKGTFPMSEDQNDFGSSRKHLIESCEASLKRLKTDYIDLYHLHGMDARTPVEETLQTLHVLVQSGKIRRNQAPPKDSRLGQISFVQYDQETLFKVIDELELIAKEREKTIAQVALNWILRKPTVANIIVGARNEEQLKQNLGAVGWKLSEAEVLRLDQAGSRIVPYPNWHQRSFPQLIPSLPTMNSY